MTKILKATVYAFCISLTLYWGCSGSDQPEKVDCTATDLAIDAVPVHPTSCTSNDGTITISASGGKAPYKYAINSGFFASSPTFSNLGGGDFIVRVKDKNGCETSTNLLLQIPGADPLSATATSFDDTECFTNNGSVEISATGGNPPYQYKIGAGTFGDVTTFNDLAPGNYSVAVRDNTNCIFTKGVTVLKGDSETSLSADIKPIIEENCAITDCHNGFQSPDLRTTASIISNAKNIKKQTQSGDMPKEGSISAAEKALIACWVDEGAKDN